MYTYLNIHILIYVNMTICIHTYMYKQIMHINIRIIYLRIEYMKLTNSYRTPKLATLLIKVLYKHIQINMYIFK